MLRIRPECHILRLESTVSLLQVWPENPVASNRCEPRHAPNVHAWIATSRTAYAVSGGKGALCCDKPVLLETSKTDEYGKAVHTGCYALMMRLKHGTTPPLQSWASTPSRKTLLKRRYDVLCFGVLALSVEIRPSAAGGTCVSCASTISFAEIFSP